MDSSSKQKWAETKENALGAKHYLVVFSVKNEYLSC